MSIKLQTNIPLTGTVKYVDYKKNTNPDWKDQISVKGNWGSGADDWVYLPLWCEGEMQRLGIIGSKQPDNKYPLLLVEPIVEIVRTEEGTKKLTAIRVLSHKGPATQTYHPPTPAATQQSRPVAASQGVSGANVDKKAEWAKVLFTMDCCFKDAGERACGLPPDAIITTAHRLFGAAVNLGLLRTPPAPPVVVKLCTKEQAAQICSLCVSLNKDDAWLMADIKSRGFQTVESMTEAAATGLIVALEGAVAAQNKPPQTEDIPFAWLAPILAPILALAGVMA